MTFEEAMESLRLRFTSCNSVPVQRALITRAEYEAIMADPDPRYTLTPAGAAMLERSKEALRCDATSDGEVLRSDATEGGK